RDCSMMLSSKTVKLPPSLSRRIVPTGIPRMAPADAAHTFPGAADRAMLADRKDKVLAATWLKSADSREQGANAYLVEADQENQDEGEDGPRDGQDFFQHVGPLSRDNLRASWPTRRGSDFFRSSRAGSCPLRGMSTRSSPTGISWRVKRNASR